jgi:hypothetical protein
MNNSRVKATSGRRTFIGNASVGIAAMAVAPQYLFAKNQDFTTKVRTGIVGGGFGASFYFHEDPNCIVEAVSDLRKDRREHLMEVYG